ncbi:MAG: hypothetical protein H0T60_02550 [Acidobacteria bacterium]|nr:hypothetical protein [Acidobacteriota bacterium]
MALVTPDYLQTQTYGAKRDRLTLQHGGQVQEGVWDAGDLKGIQRAIGANMTVDVAAGFALVKADDTGNKGFYHAENDASLNVAVAASHATLPRLDKLILRVNDTSDGADSTDIPQLITLSGTAISGTTLGNGNTNGSAPAIPNSAIVLADILVPASSTAVTTVNIRDRRPWARGAHDIVGSVSDYIQNSSTLAVVDSTKLSVRLECSGAPLTVVFNPGNYYNSAGISTVGYTTFDMFVDGVSATSNLDGVGQLQIKTESNYDRSANSTWTTHSNSFVWQIVGLVAGSHLFQPAWGMSGANGISNMSGSGYSAISLEIEEKNPIANNGVS